MNTDSSSAASAVSESLALFGNWYSTKPRVNHRRPARMRSGSRIWRNSPPRIIFAACWARRLLINRLIGRAPNVWS